MGVVDAYRLVKKEVPEIQLIMIGPTAADDPEGLGFFEKTARRAGEDPDVHLITNFKGMTDREVNAVQTLARVMVQKSRREGFGLSATGSLWHGKAGDSGSGGRAGTSGAGRGNGISHRLDGGVCGEGVDHPTRHGYGGGDGA